MVYLDLDEIPELVGPGRVISTRRGAPLSFHADDHLFHTGVSLQNQVRRLIAEKTGTAPEGPVRLLTQLRNWGYYFSPLNLFYVFDKSDTSLEYVVAEVNNTPWKQRHCYLLPIRSSLSSGGNFRFEHAKEFHVSPFMDMNLQYRWQFTVPEERLELSLANYRCEQKMFDARLCLTKCALSRATLRRLSWAYPVMTARISAAIYWQALRLWWKKCPFYPHPDLENPSTTSAGAPNRLPSGGTQAN